MYRNYFIVDCRFKDKDEIYLKGNVIIMLGNNF